MTMTMNMTMRARGARPIVALTVLLAGVLSGCQTADRALPAAPSAVPPAIAAVQIDARDATGADLAMLDDASVESVHFDARGATPRLQLRTSSDDHGALPTAVWLNGEPATEEQLARLTPAQLLAAHMTVEADGKGQPARRVLRLTARTE